MFTFFIATKLSLLFIIISVCFIGIDVILSRNYRKKDE